MNTLDLLKIIADDDLHLLKEPNESRLSYNFQRLKAYLKIQSLTAN